MSGFTFATAASTTTAGCLVAADFVRIQPTTMTLPTKPVPCPLCSARAITDANGSDCVWQFVDHQREGDAHKRYQPSGTVARMRICSECGHIWATLVKPVEK